MATMKLRAAGPKDEDGVKPDAVEIPRPIQPAPSTSATMRARSRSGELEHVDVRPLAAGSPPPLPPRSSSIGTKPAKASKRSKKGGG